MEKIDKEWIERYVKIYKHFDLLQSFPFENKDDIEWLMTEMEKKKNSTLTKEKEDLFEYLDGFDWNVYDIVKKERKKEDDGKLGFEFEMKYTRDEDSIGKKRKIKEIINKEESIQNRFEWEYDSHLKYPFKDMNGTIYLKIKIKIPWIESVKYSVNTHYYLLYENKRAIEEDENRSRIENGMMHDLFEYHQLNRFEINLLKKINDNNKSIRDCNYRIYKYIYIPIYKKNQKKNINFEKEREERYQEFCKRKEKEKIKRDINLFLKYYFYDYL